MGDGKREVCTDASGRRAQAILGELRALEVAWSLKNGAMPDSLAPLRVMLYANRSDFQTFQTHSQNLGVFQSGADRDWLLVLDSGGATISAVRHEWVHRALHHTTASLPLWLEEGIADYWSTLETSSGSAALGKAPSGRLQLLLRAGWLPANEFWAADKTSRFYRDESFSGVFYAQAWALVHMLARHPGWRGKLETYIARLAAGGDAVESFRELWGREPAEAVSAAKVWVEQGAPGFETLNMPASSSPAMQTRALDEAGGILLKVDALLANQRIAEAQELIDVAARRGKGGEKTAAARGFIALQRGDKPRALALFEEAISQGDRRGSVMLERAMLLRETGAPEAEVRSALLSAVASNPGLAEAWHLLSNLESVRGETESAIQAGEKAVQILPRQSIFWHSLGRAYLAAGRPADAGAAAAKAALTAKDTSERMLAEGLQKDAAAWRPPEPKTSARPWYEVPDGWQGPKPDATLRGRLVNVDCSGSPLLFTVESAPKQRTVLRVSDPTRILLRQKEGEKREFVCGAQKPVLLVEAGYHQAPDAASKSAGVLVVLAIEGAEPPPAPAAKPPAGRKSPPRKAAPAKPRSPKKM